MKHPFETLKPEYTTLLAQMVTTKQQAVDATVTRLLRHYRNGDYGSVPADTGIPLIFIAASFEREASSNFMLSPAQGDRWDRASVHVPAGRGPFRGWPAAALDAYHLNGLDKVGVGNWTWELLCYYGELFNGMGYRDFHREHSPYVWGATNIQQPGKYTSDGHFDAGTMDSQLGVIAMAKRMVELAPELALPDKPWPFPDRHDAPIIPAMPMPAPVGLHDAKALQVALNRLGQKPPIAEDGSYGRETNAAVRAFQLGNGLQVDGIAGPATWAAITAKLSGVST